MVSGPRLSLSDSMKPVTPSRARAGYRPVEDASALPKGTWAQMQAAFRRLAAAGRLPEEPMGRRARQVGANGNAVLHRLNRADRIGGAA